jgi:hypothetical protein
MNLEAMVIKARCTNHGETLARKIVINKDMKLEELEFKVKYDFKKIPLFQFWNVLKLFSI